MTKTIDRAPAPVPICADCSNPFKPFIDGDLGVVVLTQEYLEQVLENAFYRGFGAGLAQAAFGHLSGDEVSDEQPRPGD